MNPMRYAIMLSMAFIVTALLFPMGLQFIADANMTGVQSTVATIFTVVLPVLGILGLALAFMPPELKSKIGI